MRKGIAHKVGKIPGDPEIKNVIMVTPIQKDPLIAVQHNDTQVSLWKLAKIKGDDGKDKYVFNEKSKISEGKPLSKVVTIGDIHSACIVEDFGSLLLVDNENFFNFKLDDPAALKKDVPEAEVPNDKAKENKDVPILKRHDLTGSIKKTADHNVKAIFTTDQKHFYAIRRGNLEVDEGLALYQAEQLFD